MLFLFLPFAAGAQFMYSYSSSVNSMQIVLNDDWQQPPVMRLGGSDVLHFSFDEMSHRYCRFLYRVTHCNAAWEPSGLFDIDFIEGFNNLPIEEWENSKNTTVQYTNYAFTIPNENMGLKLSGNYIVEIFPDDDSNMAIAQYRFFVVEPHVAFEASVSGNTEIDFNRAHQQVAFTVHHPRYKINNPASEVVAVVYQNGRMDNAATGIAPAYIDMSGNNLQYIYNEKLVFAGGNEYRRFELVDPNVPGMNVEHVSYEEPYYHAMLYTDEARSTHSSYKDENGRYFVNTVEGYGTDIEADYVYVHFTLDAPRLQGGHYSLFGGLSYNAFGEENIMEYDEVCGVYRVSRLLKLGLYNYCYVWVPDDSERAFTAPVEGDFFNTDNEYLVLLYHREFASRYDKLIGAGLLNRK